jgi:hypothetical protein
MNPLREATIKAVNKLASGIEAVCDAKQRCGGNSPEWISPDGDNSAVKALKYTAPEDCVLVAHFAGDGWALAVEDHEGATIAYLAWPNTWPKNIAAQDLLTFGFQIV